VEWLATEYPAPRMLYQSVQFSYFADMNIPNASPRYSLVVFDFDGTLADSLGWLASVMPETAARFRFSRVGPEKHDYLRSLDAAELLQYLKIPVWKIPIVALHLRKRMAREADSIPLYPGVSEMLEDLASGRLNLALLSSNSRNNVLRILGPRLSDCFDFFHCEVPYLGKTRQFGNLMKKSGCAPSEVLYIGDETRDLEAARSHGVDFGAVAWGFNNPSAFERHRPEYFFEKASDITRVLSDQTGYPALILPTQRN
jgi:phosphoglycolate phosphatase